MSENKIFAGPRVRRIHNGLALTQTAMAEALAISPSYLNLIERNQRPLTVQLLLKLASVYKVDLDDLQGESAGSAGQLREVFADPLLVGEVPSPQELIEVADAAPNAASGVLKLYRAYREQAQRLLNHHLRVPQPPHVLEPGRPAAEDDGRLVPDGPLRLGVLGQQVPEPGERRGRGVVPGDEQRRHLVPDFPVGERRAGRLPGGREH